MRSADLQLCEDQCGVTIAVRVAPGARRNQIRAIHNGALKVSVTAAPEKGRANTAVRKLLADLFGLRAADVEVQQGAASQDKTISIRGRSADQVRASIAERLREA